MNDKLITEHIGYMERIATSVCRNVPRYIEAEDLFGAGYLALCLAASRFDPSAGAAFQTWAYHPVRSAVTVEAWWLVNWRAWTNIGRNRSPTIVDWEDTRRQTADPRAQQSAFWCDLARDYVRERIKALDEPDRIVLELIFLEGLTQGDIAERIGRSATSISVYRRRGLDAMKKLLEEEKTELVSLLEANRRPPERDLAKYHASKNYSRPGAKTAYIRLNKARLARKG